MCSGCSADQHLPSDSLFNGQRPTLLCLKLFADWNVLVSDHFCALHMAQVVLHTFSMAMQQPGAA